MKSKLTVGLLILILLPLRTAFANESSYPQPVTALGERLQPQELEHAQRIEGLIEDQLQQRYARGDWLRDAHPKAHGCPSARFTVNKELPAEFRHGVFLPGAQYQAVVRFSNGNPDANRPDKRGDTRGMAIKLYGVPGDKLMDLPEQADTQDFLFITFPAFFLNDVDDYAAFFEITGGNNFLSYLKLPFVLGWQGSINAFRMLRHKIDNPLTARYWSAVPYQLGEGEQARVVKYSVRACESGRAHSGAIDRDDPDFLRQALVASLAADSACMEFMLQLQPQGDYPLENVVREWPESASPFIPVARLDFPQQALASEDRAACENMAYNPWHSLPQHRPLSAVNRVRKAVYDRIRRLRQD